MDLKTSIIPHNDDDEFHDDIIENVEEVHHHLPFTAHSAEEYTETSAEKDHSWKDINIVYFIYLFVCLFIYLFVCLFCLPYGLTNAV